MERLLVSVLHDRNSRVGNCIGLSPRLVPLLLSLRPDDAGCKRLRVRADPGRDHTEDQDVTSAPDPPVTVELSGGVEN